MLKYAPLKIFIITFLNLIILCEYVNAQSGIGFSSGITYNHLILKGPKGTIKMTSGSGVNYGLIYYRHLIQSFHIELNPGLVQKNFLITNLASVQQKVTNNYLSFPILITFRKEIQKIGSIGFSAGYYGAYWTKSIIEGEVPNVFYQINSTAQSNLVKLEKVRSIYKFDRESDNRIEHGLVAKATAGYKLYKSVDVGLNFQLYQGLSDQQKKNSFNNVSTTNRTSSLNLVLTYKIW